MLFLYLQLQAFVNQKLDRDRGATAVEYGLMVGLIAAVIVGVVMALGGQLGAMFSDVSDNLPTVAATP